MSIEQLKDAWNEVVVFVGKIGIVAGDQRIPIFDEDAAHALCSINTHLPAL